MQFWFERLDQVLETISRLSDRDRSGEDVQLADWTALARLATPRSAQEVGDLFYPGGTGERGRRANLLTALDDKRYGQAYQFVVDNPTQAFPDVSGMVVVGRKAGETMVKVMRHVG